MYATVRSIRNRSDISSVYVFSAFKNSSPEAPFNSTASLIEIGKAVAAGSFTAAFVTLDSMRSFYLATLEREWAVETSTQQRLLAKCNDLFDALSRQLWDYEVMSTWSERVSVVQPSESNDYALITPNMNTPLLGWGEMLTAELYKVALPDFEYIDTKNPLKNAEWKGAQGTVEQIYHGVSDQVAWVLQSQKNVLMPGFVGTLPGGVLSHSGRWYSDVTASRVIAWLGSIMRDRELIFAIKKLFVICSADPRIVGEEHVRAIQSLSLRLLLEMIGARWADSPFINTGAIDLQAFKAGQQILLYSEENTTGTKVSLLGDPESKGVLFIQSKPVTVITITSYSMRESGYLAHITEFFKQRTLSINNITSSETSITLTINEKAIQSRAANTLMEELKKSLYWYENSHENDLIRPEVTLSPLSEIYVWGENIDSPGVLTRIAQTLSQAGINVDSNMQPFHPRVVIVWVARNRANEAVRLLHAEFIQ
jgi:aspartokinase